MIMVTSEFSEFLRDLQREYRGEIAAGKAAGYTLFAGDHILFIPPRSSGAFRALAELATAPETPQRHV